MMLELSDKLQQSDHTVQTLEWGRIDEPAELRDSLTDVEKEELLLLQCQTHDLIHMPNTNQSQIRDVRLSPKNKDFC